ncbi:MAG: phosphoenolpyruvate carboxykinase (GTP) [Actinophytocola sp.]|nr:phosphoenolpyruvate carboxykinase (GTP) [Actinophytocola sp.]
MWPGHGDDARVLAWIIGWIEGTTTGRDTPIGRVPDAAALFLTGLAFGPADVSAASAVDTDEGRAEVSLVESLVRHPRRSTLERSVGRTGRPVAPPRHDTLMR